MALKTPLVLDGGQIQQLQDGDSLPMFSVFEVDENGDSMPAHYLDGKQFEFDGNGDIEPVVLISFDPYFSVDSNGDIMPKVR